MDQARRAALRGEPITDAMLAGFERLLPLRSTNPRKAPSKTPHLPWPRRADDGTLLGVDLRARYHELRPLIVAGRYQVEGYEVEDLIAEVALIIARRNHMPCAFDPRKSSFGHYVHIVTRNHCRNLAVAHRGVDQLTDDGDGVVQEASDEDVAERLCGAREAIERLLEDDPDEARQLLTVIEKTFASRYRRRQ